MKQISKKIMTLALMMFFGVFVINSGVYADTYTNHLNKINNDAGVVVIADKDSGAKEAKKTLKKEGGQGDCDGTKTALFGCVKKDEKGENIYNILGLILDIFTYGVVGLAVIALSASGVQYALARDNEAQVVASRKRIYNIVVGLILYAFSYTIIAWLLPGKWR